MSDGEDNAQRIARVKRAGGAGFAWLSGLAASIGVDQLMRLIEGKIAYGTLEVRAPDSKVYQFAGPSPGPRAKVVLRSWKVLRRIMTEGGLGAARAFIAGEWSTPDLPAVTEFFTKNRASLTRTMRTGGWRLTLNRWRHALRANTESGAKRNIAHHYDLGNDFYAEWLDPSMTYSSAIFAPGDNSLESAQQRKYRHLLDLLKAKPGDHVLEIGSGWGGFAELAARERGVRVTGITLSEEQLKYSRARIAHANLSDQVDFELRDYRAVEKRYDHVASIEMFEAVGERYWPTFFKKVYDVLKPGGRAALQVITIEDAAFETYRRSADFIQTYIFPGGMLPTPKILREVAGRAGLAPLAEASYGSHYAETLAVWRAEFLKAWDEKRLPRAVDETFKRIWDYYLAYCEGGFRAGGIDVMQVALAKR